MTLSDPVGAGEIAHRAGVAKATVWSWQKRHSDFPAPVQLLMGPVWDWAEVEAWLRARIVRTTSSVMELGRKPGLVIKLEQEA